MQIDEKGLAKALRVERAAWSADPNRDHGDSPSTASMRAAITAYLSTLSLGTRITLVDGTEAVVVPVEPTAEMMSATMPAPADWIGHDCAKPETIGRWREGHARAAVKHYRAMLSALETK